MTIFQLIVVAVAMVFLLLILRGYRTSAARAWKKIGLCCLMFVMVITVLSPAMVDELAHLLGIGRGADLLLYMLGVAFVGYVLSNYLHQQRQEDIVHRLVRKIALIEATHYYFDEKSRKRS